LTSKPATRRRSGCTVHWLALWFYSGRPWHRDRRPDPTILIGRAVDAAGRIRRQADEVGFRGSERTGAEETTAYLTATPIPELCHRPGRGLADRHRHHRRHSRGSWSRIDGPSPSRCAWSWPLARQNGW